LKFAIQGFIFSAVKLKSSLDCFLFAGGESIKMLPLLGYRASALNKIIIIS
jgi:hypothetical protein